MASKYNKAIKERVVFNLITKMEFHLNMDYYNNYRPHRTLGNKTPSQFEDEYHERLNVRRS